MLKLRQGDHLVRDRRSERHPKGSGNGGKNKGKGKHRAVYNFADDEAEEHDDSGISIGCLVCAPAEAQLHACSQQAAETWRGYGHVRRSWPPAPGRACAARSTSKE